MSVRCSDFVTNWLAALSGAEACRNGVERRDASTARRSSENANADFNSE